MGNKFLRFLSLFFALTLGFTMTVSAQCDIVIDMQDSYGDGWNNASIKVYDGSTLLGTATLTGNTASGTETISAPDATDISLVWTAGSYDEECAFTVTNGIGIEVYSCAYTESPDAGEFFVFTNFCSTDGTDANLSAFHLPSKVAVGDVDIMGTLRSERDTPITSFEAIYTVDGVDSDVASFDGLNVGFNETYDFTHPTPANLAVGEHEITLTIQNINGAGDDDYPSNNTLTKSVLTVNEIFQQNIVYEEGTGTWCGWCPRGLVGLNTMAHNYTDGTWIGIGVHNGDPMTVTEYDNGIGTFISGYPSGVMNRKDVYDPGLSTLEPAFLAAREEIPLAKITMTNKSYDPTTRELVVEATANFAMDLAGTSYNFSLVIVENEVTGTGSSWNQSNNYSGGGSGDLIDWDGTNWADLPNPVPAADMVYQHVGRALVGGWDGIADQIPADVVYGTAYSYEFTYTLDAEFDENNVDLALLLINATDGTIANGFQAPLMGAAVLSPDFTVTEQAGDAPFEVTFTDATVGGDVHSWSWDFNGDGNEDSNEQNPTYIYNDGGTFTVSLTVTNEEGDEFTMTKENFIQVSGIGIEDNEGNIECFPNPASDVVTVKTNTMMNTIKIYNVNGQLVYTDNNVATSNQTINVSKFQRGIYFMEIEANEKQSVVKFVVE
jgi:PKD repeat protein